MSEVRDVARETGSPQDVSLVIDNWGLKSLEPLGVTTIKNGLLDMLLLFSFMTSRSSER